MDAAKRPRAKSLAAENADWRGLDNSDPRYLRLPAV